MSLLQVNQAAPSRRSARIGFLLLICLIALVAGGKAILFDTLDPDCFWHMRVAQQLRAQGIGPIVDHLSFASIPSAWTPYSWLAELAMAWLWDHAGWRSAIATQALMQAAFVGLIAWSCRTGLARSEGASRVAAGPNVRLSTPTATPDTPSFLCCAIATAFAAFLSLPYLSFRPVTGALLLLALCGVLLVRDRRLGEQTVSVWLIVPATALMVNLPLYAFFVPIWVIALLAGALWESRRSAFNRPQAERRVERYGYLMIATIVACLLTPMLPGVIASALHYQYADPMVKSDFIAEMQPFWHGTMGGIGALLVAAFALCVLINRDRLRAGEWLWLGMSAVLLFRLGRFSAMFAIVAAPICATSLPALKDRVLTRPPVWVAMALVLFLGIARLAACFPSSNVTLASWLNRHGPDAPGYPCAAAEYVMHDVRPVTGHVVNEFGWGGYLEWKLPQEYQTLLDGRTQLFTPQFWRVTYLGSDAERKHFLARVQADAAVLPVRGSKFHDALVDLGWRTSFRDEQAEVMLPPTRPDPPSRWAPAAMILGD
jgi:GNAT superfamily N-acetyltransferase/uncharacterized membrane protein